MTIENAKINSAVIAVSAYTTGYAINATATYGQQGGMYSQESNISNGTVSFDNRTVATFLSSTNDSLSIFYNVPAEQRAEILDVVQEFCADARNFISHCEVTVQLPVNIYNEEE